MSEKQQLFCRYQKLNGSIDRLKDIDKV